ncbi:hypothetical protein E3N88_46303 [Mikania micrantha]|uniref:Dehydrin n=1 Tax=Mikania micrantha TaxID=192012 RepID=A0A5N6L6X3_9ASTR|nr:hypothetical protein E3N88_46303 [Mikania micrantha]
MGHIPLGPQLQIFSPDSYLGNPGLCGPPLETNCEDLKSLPKVESKGGEWIYVESVMSGLGFGTLLGEGFGYGMLSTGRPKWLNALVDSNIPHQSQKEERRGASTIGVEFWKLPGEGGNICDEYGNPIQLTDDQGRQVQLTDEHGVPVHLTGVATTAESVEHPETTVVSETKMHGGTHFAPTHAEPVVGEVEQTTVSSGDQPPCHPGIGGDEGGTQQPGRPGSSSSSSSEEDGEGGRRKKKKGLMQKIKEKLPGHKNKEEDLPEKQTTPADVPKTEHRQHEKKGLIDKIKDKFPGHHSH